MKSHFRALLIASCFPHPRNPLLGVWALSQAEALAQHGVDLRIVSPTTYIPSALGRVGVAPWAALCPPHARVGSFEIDYPRWPVYHAGLVRKITRRFPSPAMTLGWQVVREPLLKAISQHKPDVIFAHHTFEGGEVARRIKEETGLNYVIADWDFDEITDCRRFPQRFTHYQRVLGQASAVIATSNRMKCDLLAQFPSTRVTVAHYGRESLPQSLFTNPKPPERAGKLIVLGASSFYPRKGLPVLIEAFARIEDEFPNAELWLAGDGPSRDDVLTAIRRCKPTRLRLLGPLPHDQLMQEMVWADIFALVGWDEPFATVYVEALAAAKPIICCDDGGICDVLQSGVQGLTVPPRDIEATGRALRLLLSDGQLRERMSAAAQELFKKKLTTSAYADTIIRELTRAAGSGEGATRAK